MKKVEQLIGIDGVSRSWSEVEDLYFDILMNGRVNYVSPLDKLKSLRTDAAFHNNQENQMLEYLINNFENLIKAKPVDLEQIVQQFNANYYQNLLFHPNKIRLNYAGQKILEAFSYERLRENRIVKLGSYLNIKSCLYCNSQYTLVINRKNKPLAKFQFDHFFPKNKYPYLSISLYNLIPSCASCNQSKSKTVFALNELVHPFHEDFHVLTQFEINDTAHIKLLQGQLVPENEIEVKLSNRNVLQVRNQNSFTAIESIYKRHTDIVKEIYQKAYAYRNGGKEALMHLEHNGQQLFANENEIEWMLLANYKQASDINKRPLSKFMQDIAKQAGLIKNDLL